MSINSQQVLEIAKLARLHICQEEIQSVVDNMTQLLDLVELINSVEVAGIKPMFHPFDMQQLCRKDVHVETDYQGELLSLSKSNDGKYYLVPKVIE